MSCNDLNPPLSGVLNVHKPSGLTSRTVVDRVVRLVRPAKAGHAGTLDPLATGVLIVCVGSATRLIEFVQRMPKRYVGTFLLGRSSDTEDIEGQVIEYPDALQPSLEMIEQTAAKFVGQIAQRPPAYSALKVAGRRAYDLARQGQVVELAPRSITIHSLRIVRYDYPELALDIECGSGTYVRSLGRDLAEALGTAAVMSALVRTAIGPHALDAACPLDELSSESLSRWLLPPAAALAALPHLVLNDQEATLIARGQFIVRHESSASATDLAAFDVAGRLIAILAPRGDGLWGASRNLIAANP